MSFESFLNKAYWTETNYNWLNLVIIIEWKKEYSAWTEEVMCYVTWLKEL